MIRSNVLGDQQIEREPVSIATLVADAQSGDGSAFQLLYLMHVNQVYAFAARRLSDRDAAEEATQEIFTRALEGLNRCRDRSAFSGWLFGIAHHVVNSQLRTRTRAKTGSDALVE